VHNFPVHPQKINFNIWLVAGEKLMLFWLHVASHVSKLIYRRENVNDRLQQGNQGQIGY
jgi:hypothetical protein